MLKKRTILIVMLALVFALAACHPAVENGEDNGEPVNGVNDENGMNDENDENDENDLNDENDENDENDDEDEATKPSPDELDRTDEGIIDPDAAKEVIEDRAREAMEAIEARDQERLAELTHSENGLRFTQYSNVNLEEDLVFSREDMEVFFEDTETYVWGRYDGVGDDIDLTPEEYYEEFIYSQDFIDPEEIGYNEIVSDSGTIEENQFEVYEDGIIVEYYFSGFEEEYEGMDWESLRLIFEYHDGQWYLSGIIHNQWTT